jgi:hypothetical protein
VRIGIATGLVVVGDVIAEGLADRNSVTGEAPNLAARLQGLASPNTVVVSATTRKLAAERFEYRDLGTRTVRGFRDPVPLYQVIAERPVSRLEARSVSLIPFVGREKELQILLQRWQSIRAGNGHVVILCGEAGIGKSRIAAEARARIRGMEPTSGADTSLFFNVHRTTPTPHSFRSSVNWK